MQTAQRLRRTAESVLGIVLAVTPVLLWVAWTPGILLGVMLTAVLSAALFVLLAESSGDQGAPPRRAVPPEFVAEVHRLFPLIYHHSRHQTPRFRRAMKKMSRLIR